MAHCEFKKFVFNSWNEFIEFGEKTPRHRIYKYSREDSGYMGLEWYGNATYQQAKQYALEGWPEGTAMVSALTDALVDKVSSMIEKPNIQFDVEGTDFDMGLYLKGEPECWYRFVTELSEGSGRVFKLVYNISASGSVSASTIRAKGATIAALVQCMELAGNRVELWLAGATSLEAYGEPVIEQYTLLKSADQPIDMDRLSFALAHPSTLRRFNFAVRETYIQFMDIVQSGYGCSVDCSERGDIYIPKSFAGEPYWSDPQSAIAWILKTLEQQGVKISKSE